VLHTALPHPTLTTGFAIGALKHRLKSQDTAQTRQDTAIPSLYPCTHPYTPLGTPSYTAPRTGSLAHPDAARTETDAPAMDLGLFLIFHERVGERTA